MTVCSNVIGYLSTLKMVAARSFETLLLYITTHGHNTEDQLYDEFVKIFISQKSLENSFRSTAENTAATRCCG
jgi:hypothetical protein